MRLKENNIVVWFDRSVLISGEFILVYRVYEGYDNKIFDRANGYICVEMLFVTDTYLHRKTREMCVERIGYIY